MTENDAASEFWRFSLALYARPGIKTVSLALQDEHGDDVTLLYACLFAAVRGADALTPERVTALLARVSPWQRNVTDRLRAARHAAEAAPEGAQLAAEISSTELAAERVAHGLAAPLLGPARQVPSKATAAAACSANLRAYRTETGRSIGARDQALLARLIEAAVMDLEAREA